MILTCISPSSDPFDDASSTEAPSEPPLQSNIWHKTQMQHATCLLFCEPSTRGREGHSACQRNACAQARAC